MAIKLLEIAVKALTGLASLFVSSKNGLTKDARERLILILLVTAYQVIVTAEIATFLWFFYK